MNFAARSPGLPHERKRSNRWRQTVCTDCRTPRETRRVSGRSTVYSAPSIRGLTKKGCETGKPRSDKKRDTKIPARPISRHGSSQLWRFVKELRRLGGRNPKAAPGRGGPEAPGPSQKRVGAATRSRLMTRPELRVQNDGDELPGRISNRERTVPTD